MSRIETEAEVGGIDALDQAPQGLGFLLEDVLNGYGGAYLLGFPRDGLPGLDAIFQPEVLVSLEAPGVEPRMEDDRFGPEENGQLHGFPYPLEGNPLHLCIQPSGAEVHIGPVKGDVDLLFGEDPGKAVYVLLASGVDGVSVEVDLREQPILDGKIEPCQ